MVGHLQLTPEILRWKITVPALNTIIDPSFLHEHSGIDSQLTDFVGFDRHESQETCRTK